MKMKATRAPKKKQRQKNVVTIKIPKTPGGTTQIRQEIKRKNKKTQNQVNLKQAQKTKVKVPRTRAPWMKMRPS